MLTERWLCRHADYDASTLLIPPGWFKQAKVSEGQRQWCGPPLEGMHSL